jgi:hypothetical protein
VLALLRRCCLPEMLGHSALMLVALAPLALTLLALALVAQLCSCRLPAILGHCALMLVALAPSAPQALALELALAPLATALAGHFSQRRQSGSLTTASLILFTH